MNTNQDWQVEAINHVLYNEHPLTFINRRTEDGKSLVPLTVGAIMCKIMIIIEPLLSLGSDQVDKAIVIGHNVEAYHIDEHRGVHAHTLTKRIDAITDEEWQDTTVILILSAASLAINKISHKPLPWIDYINGLCLHGLVSLIIITIDEAHYIHQNSRQFCPEFLTAMANMQQFAEYIPVFLRVITMFASMCNIDRYTIARALDVEHPTAIGGHLDCRGTMVHVKISGDPNNIINRCLKGRLESDASLGIKSQAVI